MGGIGNMGFVGTLEWLNSFSKKQCRSLFWRVKAALRKAVKNGGRQQFKFQYDPSSYALNFDDGGCHLGVRENAIKHADFRDSQKTVWVYVLWIKS